MTQMLEHFTRKEDAAILRMASNGWTPDQIAHRMCRTRGAIYVRAKKLKIDWKTEFKKSWRRSLSDHQVKASLCVRNIGRYQFAVRSLNLQGGW